MIKYILIILVFISNKTNGQGYVMVAPNFAFDTPLRDTKNLIGSTIEIGKYFGETAIGINSGWWSLDSKDFYQEIMATFPLIDKFSVSVAVGYFYHYKDITMEYDFNYTLPIKNKYSFVLSYGVQSAFGNKVSSYSFGINKDFNFKNKKI